MSGALRLGALGLLALAALGFALASGPYPASVGELGAALAGRGDPAVATLLFDARLPRVLELALIGASLGVAGAVIQTLLQNPLADPSLLGINAGATAAALVLFFLAERGAPGLVVLRPLVAFAGALGAAGVLLLFVGRGDRNPERVVLVGLALSVTLAAGLELAQLFLAPHQRWRLDGWLIGSLALVEWRQLHHGWALAAAIPLLWLLAPRLDALALGAGPATALGVPLGRTRAAGFAIAALLCAAAAALAGDVAFVGLLAGHAARALFPAGHRPRLLAAGLAGVALVCGADAIARSLFWHSDVAVGAVLGVFGVPVFALLLARRR